MNLKALIIDDEAPSRRELRYLVELVEDVQVVGEASTGNEGLKEIRSKTPHVIFLDIQIPGISGIELAGLLRDIPQKPLVIFATAFEGFALEAFDVEAFDYLMKPFSAERVRKALQKAKKHLFPHPQEARRESAEARKILLLKGDRIIPVSPEKIVCARCMEGNVVVTTRDDSFRTKLTLNELETKLVPHGFIRTHRNSLINTDQIQEVASWFHGSYKLIMNDKERTEVIVSRSNAKELRKFFNL